MVTVYTNYSFNLLDLASQSYTTSVIFFTDEETNETCLKNELTRLRLSSKPGASDTRKIFEKLLDEHHKEEHTVNLDVFNRSIGSSAEAGYLLSHWDRDCGSGVETFVKSKLPFISAFQSNCFYLIWIGFFIMVGKTTLYILDFVKDVRFIVLFNGKRQ